MLESLIITLREGIEAALVVGIVLASLRKAGRRDLDRAAYWGLLAAFLVSVAGGVTMHAFHIGDDAYEGWAYLLGAVFVAGMIVWMQGASRHLKGEIEGKIAAIGTGKAAAWGIFAFVFLMVAREGAETVLFLTAVSMNTSSLLSATGTIVGLVLAVVFGVLFVRGSVKIPLGKFFSITTGILWVVVVQLTISGFHELSEAGVLPASRQEMALIGPIVNNEAVFFLAILALVLVMILTDRPVREVTADLAEGAQRRKALAQQRRDRLFRNGVSVVAFAAMLLVGSAFVQSNLGAAEAPPTRLVPSGDSVSVPLAALADGKLHKFQYGAVRFDAIKDSASGQIHTALDACTICGPIGYRQDGENMVCKNCGSMIDVPTVGEPGGCNPIPLSSHVQDGKLLVALTALDAQQSVFPKLTSAEVLDPVCGMRLHPEEGVPMVYHGKTYYVCHMKSCQEAFEAHPERYLH